MQDAEAQRLQEERSALGRLIAADKRVINGLLSTPEGRYWVERLLEFCGLYDYDFRGNHELLIGLGRKQVGGYILHEIEVHAPDILARFVIERRMRVEADRAKKVDEEKAARKADKPLDFDDMPNETPFEAMMDQQARDLTPKVEKPK